MLSRCHWPCSRCLGHPLRTAARPSTHGVVRLQSTASTASIDGLISPVLLRRAQSVAQEHARLSTLNTENYDVSVAKKIGELGPVTAALKEWEDAQSSLSELHVMLSDPTSDDDIRSLAQSDIEETVSALSRLSSSLKTALIPPHPFAHLPALVEIHPGAGGLEASLFAHELLTAYTNLCSRLSWQHSLTDYTPDDSTPAGTIGLTSAILEISHPSAYNALRTEAGVHRVQRVPATEKKGRTHTSAVSVLVLPSLPTSPADSSMNYDDPNSDYYIAHGDVRSETMRASGAGGQHVNKTDSAIRLTHLPTGLVVAMQESRSQHSNREKAWNVLRAKLAQRRREEREQKMVELRRGIMGGVARSGREDKIRTYNFSQNRVSDHRCGAESSDLDGVMAGGESLEKLMDVVREWMADNEVKIIAAEEEAKIKA